MWMFILFSLIYPLNLYLFTLLFNFKKFQMQIKILSIFASCALLSHFINFSFSKSALNWSIAKWSILGILPFILPIVLNKADKETETYEHEDDWFIKARNYFIAPAFEELYYRILLPKTCSSVFWLSCSFSVAHSHPLLFKSNWQDAASILNQCIISFFFGFVCNMIRFKMNLESTTNENIWSWISLTIIHGIANYSGLPVISGRIHKSLKCLQMLILGLSILFLII